MHKLPKIGAGLLVSTALAAVLGVQGAWAQAPDGRQTGASDDLLGEVVVTATRQADTVNRVPLSVSAVTQRSLDQQGIKSVNDLQRTVPALTVSTAQTGTIGNFAIRGILATSGAPTTGIYLDDVPLQKRFSANSGQANGSPAPPLFDLERVEVLRGPQGTLYGGSSEGGTIRFITPAPSLTRYSVYGRGEVSTTHHGGESYELGAAVGGPLIRDKLGARVSAWGRHNGGYIDIRDPYATGAPVRFKDANESEVYALRGALTWAVTENSRITLSAYRAKDTDKGWGGATNLDTGAFTTPAQCFRGTTTAIACPAAPTAGVYVRPAQSYGPFDLGPYDSLTWRPSPYETKLGVYSFTADHEMAGGAAFKLISSYFFDHSVGSAPETSQTANFQRGVLLFRPNPDFAGNFANDNKRKGITEELRFSTSPTARPVSFVGGIFYSHITGSSYTHHGIGLHDSYAEADAQSLLLFGLTAAQRYAVAPFPNGSMHERNQSLVDTEVAAYGETNIHFTDAFTAIAGVRASRVQFKYLQLNAGTIPGHIDPLANNGQGVISGTVTESPITPKLGLQYQLSTDDMVYVTAAKGYRAGGVNPPITLAVCGVGLGLVGLTPNDIPKTYDSDSVWSYEAGAKVRLFGNRLQLNASLFRIDWSDLQFSVSVPSCGPTFVQNIGTARSQGLDLQAQARILPGLTATLAGGYTDGKYTTTAFGPKPLTGVAVPVIQKGDTLPVPPIQVSFSLQYDFKLMERSSYIRGDYQYASRYHRSPGPGVNAWAPDTRNAEAATRINMRAGVTFGPWDVNVFVNNLLESRDALANGGGRAGCPIAAQPRCDAPTNFNPMFTETYFRPREMGLQVAVRY